MVDVVQFVSAGQFGGLERVAIEGARGLMDRGLRVRLLVVGERRGGDGYGHLVAAIDASGVPSLVVPSDRSLDLRALWRVRRALRDWSPAVVHSHGVKADVFSLLSAPRSTVRVTTCHGPDDGAGLFSRLQALSWRSADAVVAVAHDTARWVGAHHGLEAVFIENGVRSPVVTERPAAGIIGFAGRLVPGKRVDLLIEALAVLRDRGLALRLVIAGRGPDEDRLRDLVASRRLGSAVSFLGHVEDMARFYASTDVLALPSASEGRPMVLLEAMAAGRAVVASAVGGVPELLGPGLGVLVDDRGASPVSAWAAGLERVIGPSGEAMRLQALATAADRTVDSAAARMITLYGALSRTRSAGARARGAALAGR